MSTDAAADGPSLDFIPPSLALQTSSLQHWAHEALLDCLVCDLVLWARGVFSLAVEANFNLNLLPVPALMDTFGYHLWSDRAFCPCLSTAATAVHIVCRLRLVALFALRYEREGRAQTSDLLQRLSEFGLPRPQLGLVRTLLTHCGSDKRVADLFSDRTFSSRFATLAKQNLKVAHFAARIVTAAPG